MKQFTLTLENAATGEQKTMVITSADSETARYYPMLNDWMVIGVKPL